VYKQNLLVITLTSICFSTGNWTLNVTFSDAVTIPLHCLMFTETETTLSLDKGAKVKTTIN